MADRDWLYLAVRQACNELGVSVIAFNWYRNFAAQVQKSQKTEWGHELQLTVSALVERYVGLGLDRKVLRHIAEGIFNVSEPTP